MDNFEIKNIEAGEILDSRGEPTVMCTVTLASGVKAAAAVPSGASKGRLEALELRDNNPKRYNGKGVLKASSNVNIKIAKVLNGENAEDQEQIDKIMINLDGTENKSKLGANAILSVSLAVSRAVSVARGLPLYKSLQKTFDFGDTSDMPTPILNIANGGLHADTNMSIQEFQIIPKATNTREMLKIGSEIFHRIGLELEKKGYDSDVGDEGGYGPDVESLDDIFQIIGSSIIDSGYTPEEDVVLGLDTAASSFYNEKEKIYTLSPPKEEFNSTELANKYHEWIEKYGIESIEDPFFEESWEDWIMFTKSVPNGTRVIGDDLLVTNKIRLQKAIKEKAVNAILVKLNQIGTLSETIEVIKLAQRNNIEVVISHRSGETNDTFISDLSVAVGAQYLKAGAPSRGERVAKYNRLIEISEEKK